MRKLTEREQAAAIWSVHAIAGAAIFAWALTFAHAQTQPAEYVLKVTPAELDDISSALQELPFKKAVPIINKLRDQVVKQQTPVVQAPVEPKKE